MKINYQHDIDELRAIGHGALSLFNAAILLAVVAVLFATASQTPQMISSFLGLVTWLIAQATKPVTGAYNVVLGSTLQPAFGGPGGTGGGTAATPATTSGTGLPATFTPDGQSTFGTVWDPLTGEPYAGIGDYGSGGSNTNATIDVHTGP